MGKKLFIAEKPSVAREFAKALGMSSSSKQDGYFEDENYIVTNCVGHLVTMSYPEVYDPEMKKWSLDSIPFLPDPDRYKYEVIKETAKQYKIVKTLLNRSDVDCIYYSGDSAREGEYIQRLVRDLAGHNPNAKEKRVWIDSQTDEEIKRGIREAKDLSEYDGLSDSGYARAIEDYSVGINLSRALTLRYSNAVGASAGLSRSVVTVGRVQSCVLGIVVRQERAIRYHVVEKYYTILGSISDDIQPQWKSKKGSSFYTEDDLYNMSGFHKEDQANQFIAAISPNLTLTDVKLSTVSKGAPLLYNLAELQAEAGKLLSVSPTEVLALVQSLYEKKMVSYPRTDSRYLSTAVSKVIDTNIRGLASIPDYAPFVNQIMQSGSWTNIANTKYVDDTQVSDHYAVIATGNISAMNSLTANERAVYDLICRRFLSIFLPDAKFTKMNASFDSSGELFTLGCEDLVSPGWMELIRVPNTADAKKKIAAVSALQKGQAYPAEYIIKQAETKPPTRFTLGKLILAMENAGKYVDDPELREVIKGAGLGTAATRASILDRLQQLKYLQIDKKQVVSPTLLGEAVFEILSMTAPEFLVPDITASWEKGLSYIADGKTTKREYLDKMYDYVTKATNNIKTSQVLGEFNNRMAEVRKYYKNVPKVAAVSESGDSVTEYTCPKCGQPLKIIGKGAYFCTDESCGVKIWPKWAGKALTAKQMETLVSGKTTGIIKGFVSKAGKSFDCRLRLDEEGRISPVFEQRSQD